MKTIIFFLILIFISSSLSQISDYTSPPGFSNNDKTPITNYRLPSWGYSILNLSMSSNFINYNHSGISKDYFRRSFYIDTKPTYMKYFESEQIVWRLMANMNPVYRFLKTKVTDESSSSTTTDNVFSSRIPISFNMKKYFSKNLYHNLMTDIQGTFYQSKRLLSDSDYENDVSSTTISRKLIIHSGYGIGYGRIRNVNPILRALRFKERLTKIIPEIELTEHQIEQIAELFTQRNGYYMVYDRPRSSFWDQLCMILGDLTRELSPADILYLEDVWIENIGDRYEGKTISLNTSYTHSYDDQGGNLEIFNIASVNFLASYYKNVTLNDQLIVSGSLSFNDILNKQPELKYYSQMHLSLGYLRNITERLIWENTLMGDLTILGDQESFQINSYNSIKKLHFFSTLTYYLEDRLSLSLSGRYNHYYSGSTRYFQLNNRIPDYFHYDKKRTEWNIFLGFTYHLKKDII